MNIFKRIGNIIMKMAPTRKANKIPEQLVQQEKTKVEPIRDIEDLINQTKSPYFSPIKTRNQRLNVVAAPAPGVNKIKATTSRLPSPAPATVIVPSVATEEKPTKKPSARELKKAKEMKSILENLKKLPAEEGPIEVVEQKVGITVEPEPVAAKKPKKPTKSKQVLKESPKVVKINSLAEENIPQSSSSVEVVPKKEKLSPSPVKGKRKSKDNPKSPEVKLEKWEPSNWTEILENIRTMRANVPAPVDTMGCDQCSDENADEKTRRFHVLLALMLSSQTKDEVTHEAMRRLTSENNCTPAVIANMEASKLETLLYPVSFYKNKAKYLKNASKILVEQYDSDIPNDIQGLMKLPGVGPKMAHICMNAAWDIVTGIGVDVHVHRISNRLGWVRQETKQPEQTRKELESWLPSDHWKEVNHLLVGFGQTICTPTKPKCGECLNKTICPAAFAVKPKKVKVVK